MIGTNINSPQRFVAATFLALVAAACSGSSSGGPANAAPVIVTASFVGAGGTPAPGDTLLLVFSEDITLVSGTLVTDADLVLSTNATLGTITAAPMISGTNTLSILLGTGVSIVPGTTTIALGTANDAVRDSTGQLGKGGAPVTIGTSDGVFPTISNVTIAAIDDELNGTGPARGTLQVPTNGWTIDLAYSDNSAIATSQTQITADVPVNTASGSQSPGTNLQPFFTEISANNATASYRIPTSVTFPNGAVVLQCLVVDVSGLASTPATYDATVRSFIPGLQPFETNVNSSQVWYVDFSRDVESYSTASIMGGVQVNVTAGSNGTSDFEDLLRILGLTTAMPVSPGTNETVIGRVKTDVLAGLATLYSGANVSFTLTQPSGSFGGNSSVAYNSLGYSQISIAGASTSSGVLGLAIFDPSNTTQNDNTQTDFQGQRLGVFLHTIVDAGMGPPSTSAFRMAFDPFAPSQGGQAIGTNSMDESYLSGTGSGTRFDNINTAIADLARFLAVVTGHECGHSMGLVENGAMPTGLYGDDSVNFPGSADGHIRNTSLFPSGSTNVMSPALSYSGAVNASSAFNSLNMAYLREQVFYGN